MAVRSPELAGPRFPAVSVDKRPRPSSFQLAAEKYRVSHLEPSEEFFQTSAQERIQKQIAATGLSAEQIAEAHSQENQIRPSFVQKVTGEQSWVEMYRQRKLLQSEQARQQAAVREQQQALHKQTQELRSKLAAESIPGKIRRWWRKIQR
jgi:hypothetical protein